MNDREAELTKLRQAFDSLNFSTENLKAAYGGLKEEASRLNIDLEENRHFLSDILNSLQCGVIVTSLDGEIILANPEAKKLGTDKPELILEWISTMTNSGMDSSEYNGRFSCERPNGTLITVFLSPLHSNDGKHSGHIFIVEDVTEIKRLRKQAHRAHRLGALGKMAATTAHEIRNPLGGMELFTSLLQKELAGDDDKSKLLAHISTGIQSINNVISNLLLFTTEPRPDRERFDLGLLVNDVIDFTRYVFEKSHVTPVVNVPVAPVMIVADQNLIRQMMLNMIHNSIIEMPRGGEFHIKVQILESESGRKRVELIFEDTGPGVPEEIREKVFDPFFTTRNSGAGLGLSIVSQIAQAHGGYVDILNTTEKGAAFIFSLPLEE